MNGQNYRCGWVALMGPPNAGKSTLLNGLMGQKVTIVTPKPQTTRNQIVGILTDDDAQAIFMDTPGLSQVRGRLSKTMIQAVWQSLGQADVIMPVDGLAAMWRSVPDRFLNLCLHAGSRPREIEVASEQMMETLRPLLGHLPFKLTLRLRLPHFQNFLEEMNTLTHSKEHEAQ